MKNPIAIDIDASDCIFTLAILSLIVLFAGTPDLMDAILYNLTDGQIKIPTE